MIKVSLFPLSSSQYGHQYVEKTNAIQCNKGYNSDYTNYSMVTKKVEENNTREVKNGLEKLTLVEGMEIFQTGREVKFSRHRARTPRPEILMWYHQLREEVFEDSTGKIVKTRPFHQHQRVCIQLTINTEPLEDCQEGNNLIRFVLGKDKSSVICKNGRRGRWRRQGVQVRSYCLCPDRR